MPSTPSDGTLEPPAQGEGLQYLMTSMINPGQEIERCKFFMTPPEGLLIKAEMIRFTPGSHHVLLYSTPYDHVPTQTIRGATIDTSDVFDCADGATADWNVVRVVGGSQSFDGKGLLNEMPSGIAVKVPGNTALLFNTHYLNATTHALEATARINVYTLPSDQLVQEAGMLFFYNPFIRIKGGSSGAAQMRCPIWKDINVVSVQSHMHRRGVGYSADLLDAQGKMKQQIYTSHSWEGVPVSEFDPVLQVKAGESIDYRCDYQNSEMRDVVQGLSTKDEMCMLIGPYYPADPQLEACQDRMGNYDGIWTGNGSASCGETLRCISGAKPISADKGDEFFGCIVDACPGVAQQVSDVVKCYWTQGQGACDAICATNGASSDRCSGCVANACSTPIGACTAAACGAQ